MFDVEGFILVGGASRRMGQDKAQLRLGSLTVLERIAREIGSSTSSVRLAGARREYAGVSLSNVPDVYDSWGALGGIHAALSAAQSEWILVVACDLPFVTRQLFDGLRSSIDENADAVVPMQTDGRPQPVCALYRRETCLPEAEKLIRAGEHTPRALLAKVHTRYVPFSDLRDLPGAENFFLNLNTPGDFERAQRLTAIPNGLE